MLPFFYGYPEDENLISSILNLSSKRETLDNNLITLLGLRLCASRNLESGIWNLESGIRLPDSGISPLPLHMIVHMAFQIGIFSH